MTATVTDQFNGMLLRMKSGTQIGVSRAITGYNGSTGAFTVSAFPGAPAAGDLGEVITVPITFNQTWTARNGLVIGGATDEQAFYGGTPVALQTGVAVSAAGIHAALVNLNLITA